MASERDDLRALRELFQPGYVIAGVFEVGGILGSGGMGVVLDAHDSCLQRRVAVKVTPDVGNLRREATAMAAVRHTGLPVIYAFGTESGFGYMVLEHIRGVELAVEHERRLRRGAPFTVREVLDVLIPLAEALAVVHRCGIVHRDVKPDNVLLTPDGRVVLVDFGLVVSASPGAREDATHAAGGCAGTPVYMAPETILGTVKLASAHLVDLYAFGVLGFELLAGRPPFEGANALETMNAHVSARAPDLQARRRDVPPALAALISELLQKDPSHRPESMDVVVWRLRALRSPRPERQQFRVLIVDDQEPIRARLELLVARAIPDAEIELADSGQAALEQVRRRAPDIMLVDLEMPGMNGLELCSVLRTGGLAEGCTMVLVSAAADEADVALLYRLGVAHFVPKGEHLGRQLSPLLARLRRDA